MIRRPATYVRQESVVRAVQWGPSWEQMKLAAEWLSQNGIIYRFTDDSDFPRSEDEPLRRLFVRLDQRWDIVEVRIGEWLVVPERGVVRIVPSAEFKADYERAEGEAVHS